MMATLVQVLSRFSTDTSMEIETFKMVAICGGVGLFGVSFL
jgi:hypothetical protein